MKPNDTVIDSRSVGNPERFLTLAELEKCFEALPNAPRDCGRVTLLVRRGNDGQRETPESIFLRCDAGMPGDAWGRRAHPNPDMQIAVMQRDIAELIARGQPLTLFGDNVFMELELSSANLPAGSRVQAGQAILEVTPMPHTGCRKFRERFGDDALRFVSRPDLQDRKLRGIYMRVIQEGELARGDSVKILSRHAPLPAQERQSSRDWI